jgi:creatinine amidohydrolase
LFFAGGLIVFGHRLAAAVFLLAAVVPSFVRAQVPPMRTRYLPTLTNPEIEQYLKRNDVIFIPVGTVETFGAMPSDMEYRMAEAYALKMAEEVDGLILPHVIYFFPGVTVTGRASVYVPQETGFAYLKSIAHSLLRQGFRRQIYLSAHGPSDQYVSGMVRQFFEETKDPILYIHLPLLNRRERASGSAAAPGNTFRSVGYGAYYILGRLDDIPLKLEVPKPEQPPLPRPPASLSILSPLAPESSSVGSYEPDPEHNGGRPLENVNMTAAERERLGKEGAALIEANVKAVNIKAVVQALRDEDKYVHDVIVPRYKDILPSDQAQ